MGGFGVSEILFCLEMNNNEHFFGAASILQLVCQFLLGKQYLTFQPGIFDGLRRFRYFSNSLRSSSLSVR